MLGMKKFALIAVVVLTFVAYSIYQRHENNRTITAPTKLSQPSASPSATVGSTPTPVAAGQYRDGQYTGSVEDAYYGKVQVRVTISGARIAKVDFLQYPSDRSTSQAINSQAMPFLQQEAIQAQSAQVDTVSGATDTSDAFAQSLGNALAQAKSL
jgi:uncharacterized protein with FMN-binding domain